MGHIVLLGDSIFDNERYVPGQPPVIKQVRRCIPDDWQATLLAVDGDIAADVPKRFRHLPANATHFFVSAGGNNALGYGGVLRDAAATVGDAVLQLAEIVNVFRREYHDMLGAVLALGKAVCVCTIYDSIPHLEEADRTALALFNDVILREAFCARVPVIDLRLLCTQTDDYSTVSPIEPSHIGGAKIAGLIAKVATTHDFTSSRCVVYW